RRAADWYQTANQVYWLITAVFSPLKTGLRYVASRAGVSRPWELLQQNLLLWFYSAYVHRLGAYLIEVNSGRLRVGVKRYRELLEGQSSDGQPLPANAQSEEAIQPVTITVMGQ